MSGRATGSAECFDRVHACRHPRRSDAEGHARQQRRDKGKQQHRHGRRCVDRHAGGSGQRGECEVQNQARARKCERQTRRATTQREQDAFRERQPHDPRGSRPQRHAQRRLPPPFHAADEHEIGDVGTDDQQHESGHHHQDLQPVLVLFAHAGDARRLRGSGTGSGRGISRDRWRSFRPSASAATA